MSALLGRTFTDALHEGLSRAAGSRGVVAGGRVSERATSARSVSGLLREHAEAIVRGFEAALPLVLEPADRTDGSLRALLVDRAWQVLATAADPFAEPPADTRPVTPGQNMAAATLLIECAVRGLGHSGPAGDQVVQALGHVLRRAVPAVEEEASCVTCSGHGTSPGRVPEPLL